ncbi:MAG TPA: methyltransferase domain-containing protein [Pyrinomonadaceae bacterium]|jgi:ubiquinone/menaquinone biosynthesis C-methylase UbiE
MSGNAPLPRAPQRSRAVYDRLASRYDRAIGPLERRFLSRLRAETLKALPDNSRVLEVGAGTGLNFPFYPDSSIGVATELSHEMLCRAQSKSRPAGVHLVQNTAEQLPFPDASFDAACATLVFCSVTSPAHAFAELRRVVKPGGTIALLEHVRPSGLLGLLFDLLNLFTVALFDDHFNRRTALEARRAGLQTLRVERHALGIINIIVCENKAESNELSAINKTVQAGAVKE